MRRSSATRLAGEQDGVVSRTQLLASGLSPSSIDRRVRGGRLIVLYPGVYAVGHTALTVNGRRRAAVLACGTGAVLSHRSAAAHWGLRPHSGRWDVTVPGDRRRAPNPSIRVHRSRTLRPDEVTVLEGVATTTVARTLLDLAAVVPAHHLRRAVEAAEQRQVFDLRQIEHTLKAHPRRAGRAALTALLADLRAHGVTKTRSDTEAQMLQLCLDHALPRPRVNHTDNGREIDFRWPDHGLVVEVDGWTAHRSRTAFTTDRRRDRAALREGLRVARYTAAEIDRDPPAVAAELAELLRVAP